MGKYQIKSDHSDEKRDHKKQLTLLYALRGPIGAHRTTNQAKRGPTLLEYKEISCILHKNLEMTLSAGLDR